MLDFIFGNTITRKVERVSKMCGEVEVLKKQQKVKSEAVCKKHEVKKSQMIDSANVKIATLKSLITALNSEKKAQLELIDKELKVEIDKVINRFNLKIIAKQHKINALNNNITAERKNIDDVMNPENPNAPIETKRKKLLEDKE